MKRSSFVIFLFSGIVAVTLGTVTPTPFIQGTKATTSASDVVLFFKDGYADIWTDRFVKAQPLKRSSVLMPRNPTTSQVVSAISSAARLAGQGGTLIFNVGHGASDAPIVGMVELAPGNKMSLGSQGQTNIFVNVFYDVNLGGPNSFSDMEKDIKFYANSSGARQRRANWEVYKNLGKIVQNARIRRVIFLTCNVGNATEFVKKIANDWGTVVEAYKRRIKLEPQSNGNVRMYLEGDAPGTGTNIPENESEMPLATESNSYRAGST
jgi:hypothetical protein